MDEVYKAMKIDPKGIEAKNLDRVMQAAAIGLFAAMIQGLIKFPAGMLTIGEVETKIRLVANAVCAKLNEGN